MVRLISALGNRLLLLLACVFLSSCATPSKIQSQVKNLTLQNNYSKACTLLNDNPARYGRNNILLYLLDKGFILHLAGDYKASIDAFDKAKLKFDELYTKSVSGIVSTWLINEYSAPYRGEDFERVMINIFQALNYLMTGNLEEALVEARDVDIKLAAINTHYKPNEKNVYKEDAFARFLMGILYEAHDTREDLNNAFISYAKAIAAYEDDYVRNYGLTVPDILKENILSVAEYMGRDEFTVYKAKYKGVAFLSLKEKAKKSEVYLIEYNGFSPVKEEAMLLIPLPDAYVFKLAFPKYVQKSQEVQQIVFGARGSTDNEAFEACTQAAEDISALAVKTLENRKVRVRVKALTAATGRYLWERKQEENIRKRLGGQAADGFKIVSNLFNVYSAKADVRSWHTLPSEIRIARLFLEPGEYSFFVDTQNAQGNNSKTVELGRMKLSSGEKKFFLIRT